MEIVIVICLLIAIVLLVEDMIYRKQSIKRTFKRPINPKLPEIMGDTKPFRSQSMPKPDIKRQLFKSTNVRDNFESETEEVHSDRVISEEELDEIFGSESVVDLNEEEDEWRGNADPNGEDGFATGVTFEELNIVGNLLQRESLEPSLKRQAVDIVYRIQGTDLFSLLEDSMENASQKIALLLDKTITTETGASPLPKYGNEYDGFDIGEFV